MFFFAGRTYISRILPFEIQIHVWVLLLEQVFPITSAVVMPNCFRGVFFVLTKIHSKGDCNGDIVAINVAMTA